MSGQSVDELIAEARQHLDAADERQRSADDEKWAAAELLWRLNKEHGIPKRELAKRVAQSEPTVRRYIAVWVSSSASARTHSRSFTEAYMEMRGPSDSRQGIADREVRKAIRERPESVAEAITRADTETQQKIADALVSREPEPSLRDAVAPPRPPAPEPPSPERVLGRATFMLWEVSQMLLDDVPAGDAKVRMSGDAQKAERLAKGIAWLLDTGEIDEAFSTEAHRDQIARALQITPDEFEVAIPRARDLGTEHRIWLTPVYERPGWWTGYPTDRILARACAESSERNIGEASRNRSVAQARAAVVGTETAKRIASGVVGVGRACSGAY